MKRYGILNAFQLKIIMLVLMLLDHMYLYLFPKELLPAHYASRLVAPVFTFLVAEGMVYTRDRRRFISRLFISGAVMAAGNYILYLITGYEITNNFFLSLAVGAAAIYALSELFKSKGLAVVPWALTIIILAFLAPLCEGGYMVPTIMLIFYYLRKAPPFMYAVYVASMGWPYFAAYLASGYLRPQFYMVFAVIPLMLYNGKRGPDTAFAKYFFYVFYPLHVWILFLISRIV
ncbi:MAG: conjugal transfer protein TraX [Oscillospiraceae bacterium]|nr:conjugal transfer protein TraX [Oscillospiraceae bacterium]